MMYGHQWRAYLTCLIRCLILQNFGDATIVLNVDATKAFSSLLPSPPPYSADPPPTSPPPADLSIESSGAKTPSFGSGSPVYTWPSTAPSSNAPADSPVTVKPSIGGGNTWMPPSGQPTWTQSQRPAVVLPPPCEGFNCNKPDSSSDAGKSDDKDSKDEGERSSHPLTSPRTLNAAPSESIMPDKTERA